MVTVTEQVHKIRAINRARLEYKHSVESAFDKLQGLVDSGLIPQDSMNKALDVARIGANRELIAALDREFRN